MAAATATAWATDNNQLKTAAKEMAVAAAAGWWWKRQYKSWTKEGGQASCPPTECDGST